LKIVWIEEATADREAIMDHIARDDLHAAVRVDEML
jgi:plasmid stabilization system protein ParE